MSVSWRDLGYDEFPIQLSLDALSLRDADAHLQQGKLPGSSSVKPSTP